jgi:GDP-4-dehydro-6-deoxy-D-mannose reductase
MKVLITGSLGFSGRHLNKYLGGKNNLRVFTTDIGVSHLPDFFTCDFTKYEEVLRLIVNVAPDQIYHLAGALSNDYAIDYSSNVLATKVLFDALLTSGRSCRVLLVGSSAEYGLINKSDNPVKETQILNPVSIYGLTKVYQTHLMKLYHQLYGINVVMARTFNLMGSGMSERLFVGRIFNQITEYKKGTAGSIMVGNLESRRDYIDISDAIQYYELIMNFGKDGEIYNIGTGCSIRMRDFLKNILFQNGLDMSIVQEVPIDLSNKLEVPDLFADITKVTRLRDNHWPDLKPLTNPGLK